ncbi:hypothetical protein PSACC_00596 [Paramicrosporidium saccamoebae]|uniref:Myb-like domain-containing protein n=1 Tax=Paramicrosporidium saccamoebae TaxID=1246581 RepID=A0A2H9TPE4_9FUNG|nr:hypothetical protein PSACC_00596 [Paramicrosporidium saccamoebae]
MLKVSTGMQFTEDDTPSFTSCNCDHTKRENSVGILDCGGTFGCGRALQLIGMSNCEKPPQYINAACKPSIHEPVSIEDLIPKYSHSVRLTLSVVETSIATVGEGLCKAEAEAIRSNLIRQQEQIRSMYDYLTAEEVFEVLGLFNDDEDLVVLELTKPETLSAIRKSVALKYTAINNVKAGFISQGPLIDRESVRGTADGTEDFTRAPVYKCEGRLRLDDAVAQLDTNLEDAMKGWSTARVRAFNALKDKPNTYYYRFNAPGEQQRNGAWTSEEHRLFMKRIAEVGADGQWGIFSMSIPGRVGYQKGKAHYVFGTKSKEIRLQEKSLKRPNAKRVRSQSISSESEQEATVVSPLTLESECEESQNSCPINPRNGDINPLPGFIDFVTRQEVTRPAISPYGHVLSYDTWLRCLCTGDRRNICPFTNQPLYKRQLVILTEDNVFSYRDMIQQSL